MPGPLFQFSRSTGSLKAARAQAGAGFGALPFPGLGDACAWLEVLQVKVEGWHGGPTYTEAAWGLQRLTAWKAKTWKVQGGASGRCRDVPRRV